MNDLKIAVIGLGYVGLEEAMALGKQYETIGYDKNPCRVRELNTFFDRNKQFSSTAIKESKVLFTHSAKDIGKCSIYIIAVPTPINKQKKPNLTCLIQATKTVASALNKGNVVLYVSTVYPGATEEKFAPMLTELSGLFPHEFCLAYSPERINPGDKNNTFENIEKIISANSSKGLYLLSNMYGSVLKAGTFKVSSIKVAEAAKIIENTQRDVNIALINEFTKLLHQMNIDISEVLAAAKTKWNFLNFTPGLVGGHCISVDPYYLIHRSVQLGYKPELMLTARKINEAMPNYAYKIMEKHLSDRNLSLDNLKVIIMGLTFKENCPDLRNSKTFEIINCFKKTGATLTLCDPTVTREYSEKLNLVNITDLPICDVIVFAVPHKAFMQLDHNFFTKKLSPGGIVFDIKGSLNICTVKSIRSSYKKIL